MPSLSLVRVGGEEGGIGGILIGLCSSQLTKCVPEMS